MVYIKGGMSNGSCNRLSTTARNLFVAIFDPGAVIQESLVKRPGR